MMWYIWLHENSPLFGKNKMATFERYFLDEKELHKEKKNPYYELLEDEHAAMIEQVSVVYFVQRSLVQQEPHMFLQPPAILERLFQTVHDVLFLRRKIW